MEIEKAIVDVTKKIFNDPESIALLRLNQFMRDEVRFLNRQIDRLEYQISNNRCILNDKYNSKHHFSIFWFWRPIEKAFLIDESPNRKKLIDYFDRYLKENNK